MTTDLIKRLEEAAEGSRDLDCRVAYHIGWRHCGFRESGEIKESEFKHVMEMAGHWHLPGDKFADILNKPEYRKGFAEGRWPAEPPHYTTSLDAAMTLVPEGYGWCLDYMDPGEPDGAMVGQHTCDATTFGKPITPALALCIAALKAKDQS